MLLWLVVVKKYLIPEAWKRATKKDHVVSTAAPEHLAGGANSETQRAKSGTTPAEALADAEFQSWIDHHNNASAKSEEAERGFRGPNLGHEARRSVAPPRNQPSCTRRADRLRSASSLEMQTVCSQPSGQEFVPHNNTLANDSSASRFEVGVPANDGCGVSGSAAGNGVGGADGSSRPDETALKRLSSGSRVICQGEALPVLTLGRARNARP